MTKKLSFIRVTESAYSVHCGNRIIGELLKKEDGFFDFWPDTRNGGYWDAGALREMAGKLDELNAPWEKNINDYFDAAGSKALAYSGQ